MIEVFKTNVKYKKDARRIVSLLNVRLTRHKINFDLSDCDKILRIENDENDIQIPLIEKILFNEGFHCEVLPD
ncbi:MAG: hypothetical protein H6Q18_418 [Bacteroidetes bacterium]|nr:hypothetical protein [Bacteroidota bacterium]